MLRFPRVSVEDDDVVVSKVSSGEVDLKEPRGPVRYVDVEASATDTGYPRGSRFENASKADSLRRCQGISCAVLAFLLAVARVLVLLSMNWLVVLRRLEEFASPERLVCALLARSWPVDQLWYSISAYSG